MSDLTVAPAPDAFVRRARPAFAYVITVVVAIFYIVLPLGEALFGARYTHLSEAELATLIAPVVYYIFQRTYEKRLGIAS